MNYYRICKYPSECRRNGIYYTDEWTSFSDVGRECSGAVLTMSEYVRVETNYLLFLLRVWEACGAQPLEVRGFEAYADNLPWKNGIYLERKEVENICRDILREKCWCRLDSEQMHVHFGYDFYMHIGCELSLDKVERMAADYGLTVDEWHAEDFEEEDEDKVFSNSFFDYCWADRQLEKIEIEYDCAKLTVLHDVSGQLLTVICRGLAGVNNVCIWDDTIIFSAFLATADEKDPFVAQLYAAYDKNADYGGRRLDNGLMELRFELVNGTRFSVYCQSVEVVSGEI